jgi:hypothetical protein
MLISGVLVPDICKQQKSITVLLNIMMQMTKIFHFYSLCYIKVFENPEEVIHKLMMIKLMAFSQFLLYSQ